MNVINFNFCRARFMNMDTDQTELKRRFHLRCVTPAAKEQPSLAEDLEPGPLPVLWRESAYAVTIHSIELVLLIHPVSWR